MSANVASRGRNASENSSNESLKSPLLSYLSTRSAISFMFVVMFIPSIALRISSMVMKLFLLRSKKLKASYILKSYL